MNHSQINGAARAVHTIAQHPSSASNTRRTPDSALNASAMNAVINVRNLRLRTYIGFNPDERSKQQDIVINIEIGYSLSAGVLDDKVDEALNYKTITKRVIDHVENGRFLLLEKLVADVLTICSDDARTGYARVRIDKPHALRFADSVSVALEYVADEANNIQENIS